eukprot:scaffold42333_cov112-Phaeocystis_antarctica.AAC.1
MAARIAENIYVSASISYQYPVAVKWGGATDLELSQPSPPPFTEGEKEMGLHFAADASPEVPMTRLAASTGGVGMLCGGAIASSITSTS